MSGWSRARAREIRARFHTYVHGPGTRKRYGRLRVTFGGLVGVPFCEWGLDYASLYRLEKGAGALVRLLRALPRPMRLPPLTLVLCHGGVAVPRLIYVCNSATQSFGCQIISLLTCSAGMTSWEIRHEYDVRFVLGPPLFPETLVLGWVEVGG
jgi:hypothetical protein